jgi:thioredoxin-related protein
LKKIIPILLVVSGAIFLFANTNFKAKNEHPVKWMSLEEAQELNKKQPRKILIDVYTDWCGWCKKMDANTFDHPYISKYINEKYYAVKLNAETKDTIMFNGKMYVNPNPSGGRSTHQVAYMAAQNGRLGYPTIVYLDEELNLIQAIASYMTPEQIEPVLVYFGEDYYKNTASEKFMEEFKSSIK